MRKLILASAITFSVLFAGAVAADDDEGPKPDDLFASAKAAYGEKKYGKALADLNQLSAAVAKLRVDQLKAALPGAPSGWTAEEATGDATGAAIFLAGTSVKRGYSKGEGEAAGRVDLELLADSPMAAAIGAMITNPMLVQGQEGKSIVTIKNRKGLVEWMKGEKSGKLTLPLNSSTSIVTLSGSGLEKTEFMDAFAKAFDWEKLEKAIQE